MTSTNPVVAVVPIRAGSRGLVEKNVRLLDGKPLYRHAVDLASAVGVDSVLISTDIVSVLDGDQSNEVRVLRRPEALCGDAVPMSDVVMHLALDLDRRSTIVLLQATSPLRTAANVSACLELFNEGRHRLVMSVAEVERSIRKSGSLVGDRFIPFTDATECFSNRQSLPPAYRPNGAVFVFDSDWFVSNGGFVTESIGVHQMSSESSIDIDDEADFQRVVNVMRARRGATASERTWI